MSGYTYSNNGLNITIISDYWKHNQYNIWLKVLYTLAYGYTIPY